MKPVRKVIYASATYSTAMLEMLAHWNGTVPPNQHFVEITIPRGTRYEVATADTVPGWAGPGAKRPVVSVARGTRRTEAPS